MNHHVPNVREERNFHKYGSHIILFELDIEHMKQYMPRSKEQPQGKVDGRRE